MTQGLLKLPTVITGIQEELNLILYGLILLGLKQFGTYIAELLKDKNKLFVLKSKRAKEIHESLKELRVYMHAERTSVFDFSNSDKNLSGLGFQFMTMVHENADLLKVSRVARYFNKVHVSLYPFLLDFSPDNPKNEGKHVPYKIYHIDDENLSQDMLDMMTKFNVKSTLVFQLHPKKLMHGTLSINWHSDFYRTADEEGRARHLSYLDLLKVQDTAAFVLKNRETPHWWEVSILNKNKPYL